MLALAGPILRRVRIWPRTLTSVGLIGLFGVMTRFEPSVLRASAMAALAAGVATTGARVHRLRLLALAVTGLVLVDPLLVRSVGFQLSVAACLSIVAVAPRVSAALPGPPPLRDAMGVTVAAQLGVAPILLHTFGPVPVASLPANLLAVPVAGLVMGWGLTAGLLAGVAGPGLASALHLPTRLALTWLELVAAGAARAGLGELGWVHLLAVAAGLSLAVAMGRHRAIGRSGLAMAALACAAATLTAQAPAPLRAPLATGVVHWHGPHGDVVVLGGTGGRSVLGASRALEALRRGGVGSIALLVVADESVEPGAVAAVRRAHPVGTLVAAGGAAPDLPGAVAVAQSGSVDVGGLRVQLTVTADRVAVDAARIPERGG